MLDREEYVEQAHFFGVLGDRIGQNTPMQEILSQVREEILATSDLPKAIDYLLSELKHAGVFHTAMARMSHYFTAFQAYVVEAAEDDRGRFDLRVAIDVLREEALYRAQESMGPQGLFLYQFEVLCRNRMSYDRGLAAIAEDPYFDADWRKWILTVRRQMGLVDFADLIYVRSEYYIEQQQRKRQPVPADEPPPLFGVREGRIALANRHKNPVFLFAALQRQLAYPEAPKPRTPDVVTLVIPQLQATVARLETRVQMLEEEQRGGIDLSKLYERPPEKGE